MHVSLASWLGFHHYCWEWLTLFLLKLAVWWAAGERSTLLRPLSACATPSRQVGLAAIALAHVHIYRPAFLNLPLTAHAAAFQQQQLIEKAAILFAVWEQLRLFGRHCTGGMRRLACCRPGT